MSGCYRKVQSDFQARLAAELAALRQCREWLEHSQRGERLIVNLGPESDPETEDFGLDGPRILRVLGRIIGDLNALAGLPPQADQESTQEDAEARRVRHRQRLAEPEPPPKPLSVREERARCGPCWTGRRTTETDRGRLVTPIRRPPPGCVVCQESRT